MAYNLNNMLLLLLLASGALISEGIFGIGGSSGTQHNVGWFWKTKEELKGDAKSGYYKTKAGIDEERAKGALNDAKGHAKQSGQDLKEAGKAAWESSKDRAGQLSGKGSAAVNRGIKKAEEEYEERKHCWDRAVKKQKDFEKEAIKKGKEKAEQMKDNAHDYYEKGKEVLESSLEQAAERQQQRNDRARTKVGEAIGKVTDNAADLTQKAGQEIRESGHDLERKTMPPRRRRSWWIFSWGDRE